MSIVAYSTWLNHNILSPCQSLLILETMFDQATYFWIQYSKLLPHGVISFTLDLNFWIPIWSLNIIWPIHKIIDTGVEKDLVTYAIYLCLLDLPCNIQCGLQCIFGAVLTSQYFNISSDGTFTIDLRRIVCPQSALTSYFYIVPFTPKAPWSLYKLDKACTFWVYNCHWNADASEMICESCLKSTQQ